MRKTSKSHQDRWQPMADVFSALALIFMLLLMLLLATWLVDVKEAEEYSDRYSVEYTQPDDEDGHHYDYPEYEEDDGGGNGDHETEPTEPEETEPWEEYHGDKAAVRVFAVDAETGLIIQQEGISFYLYNDVRERRTLYTYYPVRTGYDTFETLENGTFYFPEKLEFGEFTLRNISAPEGYVSGTGHNFYLDEDYEWDEPYLLYFEFDPIQRTISILVADAISGTPVPGGKFEIIAASNVVRADGSVFAYEGDVIEQLIPDSNGYAESSELNPASIYAIRQVTAAPGYTVMKEVVTVNAANTSDIEQVQQYDIAAQKSRVSIIFQDELYGNGLEGIRLSLSREDGSEVRTYQTSSDGSIEITDLEKNANYKATQITWNDGYQQTEVVISFHVDSEGYIDGTPSAVYTSVNRITRTELRCLNWFSHTQVEGMTLQVYDGNNELVSQVPITSAASIIEGLHPGTYRIALTGQWNYLLTGDSIDVKDSGMLQSYQVRVLTLEGLIVFGVLLALLIIILLVIIIIKIVKRKKRKSAIY